MRTSSLAAALAAGAAILLIGPPTAVAGQARAPARPAPATTPAATELEPDALNALKRMGAYLGTLNTFEVQTRTSLDIVTNEGQRIQLDGTGHYKVRRPDAFVIEAATDLKQRSFFYDGKRFTVYAPKLGYYATADAPPTIPATLDILYDKFGIALPLEDLFRWNNPTDRRIEQVESGFVVGTATLDGVKTDHYAFREKDVDWQVWIQQGAKPLPLKLVIVDRSDPANPAYSARLAWVENPVLSADDFTFKPGKDAKPIRITAVGQ